VIRHFAAVVVQSSARCFQRGSWFLVDSLRTNLCVGIDRCSLPCRLAFKLRRLAHHTDFDGCAMTSLAFVGLPRTVSLANFVRSHQTPFDQSPFAWCIWFQGTCCFIDGCPAT